MKKQPFTTAADLKAFSQAHHETAAMTAIRMTALQQYLDLPLAEFPKINYRRWLLDEGQPFVANNTSVVAQQPITVNVDQQGTKPATIKLSAEAQATGVVVLDFFTAQAQYPELFAKYYMTLALPKSAHQLAAYHAASVNSGVFIYVPQNVKLTEPLTLNFQQDTTTGQTYVHHVLLVAGEDSDLTILESRQSDDEQVISGNIVEELILEQGAHVHFTAIDRIQTVAYLARRAYLMKNARLDWALGLMNDGDILSDFNTDLVGEGSHTEFKAVAIATGSQSQGVTTRITNYGQHTEGNILQHGVILSDATLIFNGIGHIVRGARDSDAQQENRVLMLSRTARGDANPILLIDENDVRAGHAASVGRVDQSQMYYLMSRGLSKDVAERLVIRGFLGSVLAEIPSAEARDALKRTIERKLIDGQKHRDSAE
ncbi:Fe-S cluster assembly protein SufD [Lapidilactobacillus bayanensis]|uniref:Fe-S cluster assembly protein SufD n=1 Tax=Lapidilactobacillus bayanensis TaxID=2485998 RepID=UPI001CDBEF5B|nr:Fe-S cluster assembly protein SufD [Lapidilactobacillus bayanensis]